MAENLLKGTSGVNAALLGGKTGLLKDVDIFGTADEAWLQAGLEPQFPGRLLVTTGGPIVGTVTAIGDLFSFAGDYAVTYGALPDRAALLDWAKEDGMKVAALSGAYAAWHGINGKQISAMGGYGQELVTADGNQRLIINADGHVVAAELTSPINSGASVYELEANGAAALVSALTTAGFIFNPALTALGVGTIGAAFNALIDPVFDPYVPTDWGAITYPFGEGEPGASVPNAPDPTPFALAASASGETLFGTSGVLGGVAGGADSIDGGGGNDVIFGGGGDDHLWGGEGNDIIWAQEENDTVEGGNGDDTLRGGEGDDILKPGEGSNYLDGGDPLTAIDASGMDTADYADLDAGKRIAVVIGGGEAIERTAGLLHVTKESGSDTLVGIDRVIGTNAPDSIVLQPDGTESFAKIDYIDLGDNLGADPSGRRPVDYLDASALARPVTVHLEDVASQIAAVQGAPDPLYLRHVEGVIGSEFDDDLFGIAQPDALGTGSALYGQGGNDSLTGGEGVDWLEGGSGFDYLDGGLDANRLFGGDGADKIVAHGIGDILDSGAGNDILQFASSAATIEFKMGDGSDLVEFLYGDGDYTLSLRNLNPGDIEVYAGGRDIYNPWWDYSLTPGMQYQFIGVRIKATGDQITFLENGRNIGPDGNGGSVAYNEGYYTGFPYGETWEGDYPGEGKLDSVRFANGTVWDQHEFWRHIEVTDSWGYDFDYAGDRPDSEFLQHVTETYLQADADYAAGRSGGGSNFSAQFGAPQQLAYQTEAFDMEALEAVNDNYVQPAWRWGLADSWVALA